MTETKTSRPGSPGPATLRARALHPPLAVTPAVDGERFLFIGGLHRSGTSILHRLLRAHPQASGFADTGVPQDEGQHLQTVFPTAHVFGGPGRFAFHEAARLIGIPGLVSTENRERLLREWGAFYDLGKTRLLEKSPPNIIRGRFLQALFPGARFVFLVRHPVPVSYGTQKWSKTSLVELLFHWCVAHSILLEDLPSLDRVLVLRYEDLVSDPAAWLEQICSLAELGCVMPQEVVTNHNAKYFLKWHNDAASIIRRLDALLDMESAFFTRFGYSLTEPFVNALPRPL